MSCLLIPVQAQEGSPYRLETPVVRDEDGSARLTLTIHAVGEWKWNDEFPFSLVIDRQDGVNPGRDRLARDDVKVAPDHKSASVSLGRVPTTAMAVTVTGKANFGLCMGDRCRQFRNVEVGWSVGAVGL